MAASSAPWYDVDNDGGKDELLIPKRCFERERGELFACPVCLDIPAAPRFTAPCGHLGCKSCLERIAAQRGGACPLCRERIGSVCASPNMANIIAAERLVCDEPGCYWHGVGLDALLQHVKSCALKEARRHIGKSTELLRGTGQSFLSVAEAMGEATARDVMDRPMRVAARDVMRSRSPPAPRRSALRSGQYAEDPLYRATARRGAAAQRGGENFVGVEPQLWGTPR